jgi:hypothetical protein
VTNKSNTKEIEVSPSRRPEVLVLD